MHPIVDTMRTRLLATKEEGLVQDDTSPCVVSSSRCPTCGLATASAGRSNSIPIPPGNVKRTPSEQDLVESEVAAEERDTLMFRRIVEGISRQQNVTINDQCRCSNEMCLARIIRAQSTAVQDLNPIIHPPILHPTECAELSGDDDVFHFDL